MIYESLEVPRKLDTLPLDPMVELTVALEPQLKSLCNSMNRCSQNLTFLGIWKLDISRNNARSFWLLVKISHIYETFKQSKYSIVLEIQKVFAYFLPSKTTIRSTNNFITAYQLQTAYKKTATNWRCNILNFVHIY